MSRREPTEIAATSPMVVGALRAAVEAERTAIGRNETRGPLSADLMRGMTKNLWMQVGKLHNPWFTAVSSNLEGYRERWERWDLHRIELMQAMFSVLFENHPPTEVLLVSALALIESSPCPS